MVLPDYQGLGLGHKLSSIVAEAYVKEGYKFMAVNSTKSLFEQRKRSPNWIIKRKGRHSHNNGPKTSKIAKDLYNTGTNRKITYSYEYVL